MTQTTILVEIKNNYGKQAIYPVCKNAKYFAELAGTKTLTSGHIDLIKKTWL
jgi:hypothetical protein